jgi:hypothetical protein
VLVVVERMMMVNDERAQHLILVAFLMSFARFEQ